MSVARKSQLSCMHGSLGALKLKGCFLHSRPGQLQRDHEGAVGLIL